MPTSNIKKFNSVSKPNALHDVEIPYLSTFNRFDLYSLEDANNRLIGRIDSLEQRCEELRKANEDLTLSIDNLKETVEKLTTVLKSRIDIEIEN